MSTNDLSSTVIFPVGEKLESDHFNGTVWLNMMIYADAFQLSLSHRKRDL